MKHLIPTLETPRLLLRPMRITDAPQIQRLFPHWEVLKYMTASIPWPYPENGAYQALQEFALPSMEEGREYHWAITLKSRNDDLLIGNITLTPNNADHRGFWLAPEYRNRGLMREAVFAATDFAFYELGMPHLILLNAEPNRASHRLKEMSGARIVAIDEDIPYVGGRFRRIRWLLTREDWESHRPLLQARMAQALQSDAAPPAA